MAERHVLGISGGKDSAALAVYMRDRNPELDIEYFFTDTGEELPEVYEFLGKLEDVRPALAACAARSFAETPFNVPWSVPNAVRFAPTMTMDLDSLAMGSSRMLGFCAGPYRCLP